MFLSSKLNITDFGPPERRWGSHASVAEKFQINKNGKLCVKIKTIYSYFDMKFEMESLLLSHLLIYASK